MRLMGKISIPIEQQQGARGQALVELALVLILLAMLIFGALDLGRGFFAYITITNAARNGARYGTMNVVDPTNTTAVKAAVVYEANNSGITITNSNVNVICVDTAAPIKECDRGKEITVTVTYDFDLILGWILPSPMTIRKSIVMVVQ